MEENTRNSGIELLRIFSMFGVIVLHYIGSSGMDSEAILMPSINYYILFFLESLCICAVDLFILISGYFLCSTQKRSLSKVMELILQLIMFKEAGYLLTILLGENVFSIKTFFVQMVPSSYYVILYIALYVISPYINIIFIKFDDKAWNKFICTAFLLFSVYPILVDLSGEVLHIEWFGLSTVGAWGNQQGFTIVNFILVYLVGAYIRFHGIRFLERAQGGVILGITAIFVGLIFLWALFNEHTAAFGLRSAWCYHNPLVIAVAAVIFLQFRKMKFYSRWINELAKAAFTCFLCHVYLLGFLGIGKAVVSDWWILLLHVFLALLVVYLLSYMVYKIYHFCTGWFVRYLAKIVDKVNISIVSE